MLDGLLLKGLRGHATGIDATTWRGFFDALSCLAGQANKVALLRPLIAPLGQTHPNETRTRARRERLQRLLKTARDNVEHIWRHLTVEGLRPADILPEEIVHDWRAIEGLSKIEDLPEPAQKCLRARLEDHFGVTRLARLTGKLDCRTLQQAGHIEELKREREALYCQLMILRSSEDYLQSLRPRSILELPFRKDRQQWHDMDKHPHGVLSMQLWIEVNGAYQLWTSLAERELSLTAAALNCPLCAGGEQHEECVLSGCGSQAPVSTR